MATGKLDRKDWGMSWNKALDTGGMVVSDEVKLEINAELTDRAATSPDPAAAAKPAAPPSAKTPPAKPAK
jgi:hypothetical protein